ncbi:MAG: heme exporter protein CcmD [Alsobacter sp.]|jgi:heme exporter protein D|nr:heme exporter protein CcmD [Burkholderiales bacterium]
MFGLGPHGGFIVASYAAAVLIVGGLILRAVIDHRMQKAALARLEERGARRRSDRARDAQP